jgi:hypothetical protein
MKPDVLKQMVEIDRERAAMNQQQMQQQQIKIIMKRDGAPDVELSIDDIMKIVKQQQEQIEELKARLG